MFNDLINIFKICFFLFVYLVTVLTGNNRISYPHFEARAYWKISICFLYLLLIFIFITYILSIFQKR